MLAYLVSDGHLRWMFRSGAWWRILINHRSQISTRLRGGEYHSQGLTAGEFVSKYTANGLQAACFVRGENVQWTKVEQD